MKITLCGKFWLTQDRKEGFVVTHFDEEGAPFLWGVTKLACISSLLLLTHALTENETLLCLKS